MVVAVEDKDIGYDKHDRHDMKGVTIEKTTAFKEPFAGISESRDGTWDWSSTHQPTRLPLTC